MKNLLGMLFIAFLAVATSGALKAEEKAVPLSKEQATLSYAPVVKKAAPAVVNIYTKSRVQVQEQSPLMNDPFFKQFFGQQGLVLGGRTHEQVISSLGSGVIIKPDGLIVTSHHVINNAQEITVVLSDKREFEATVTARDPRSDLAFLRIKNSDALPFLELRDSDSLEVGDMVLAIGNPFGVGQTVTGGIISALARGAAGVSDYQFFIQTDAAINPGNSGGALVDMNGRLIGVNTAIYSKTGGYQGIGFAIPANMINSLLSSNIENGGKIVRPWIGASAQAVTSEMAESLGLKSPHGVIVNSIAAGSPAEKAGLKVGDVILSVDGVDVSTDQEVLYRIALVPLGKQSQLKILRAGAENAISVEMVAPPETTARDVRRLKGKHPLDAVTVANLSPALATEIGMEDLTRTGVIVMKVEQAQTGINVPMQPGDIILQVNESKITSTKQLEAVLKRPSNSWQIVYQRGAQTLTLTVRM